MKSKRTTFLFFIVVLALTAQLSFISPLAGAQNTNSSTTMEQNTNSSTTMQTDNRCRRRCANSYRRCLRSGKNRTACRKQYRNCLRRCA